MCSMFTDLAMPVAQSLVSVLSSDRVDLQSHRHANSAILVNCGVGQIPSLTWHLVYLLSVLSKVWKLVDEALVAFEVHLRNVAG